MRNKNHSAVVRRWPFLIGRAFLLALVLFSASRIPAQEAKRYSKAADQIVTLINAGDCSAIEKLFNDPMQRALPLDKTTSFFTGLTSQFGKIQKLDAPVRKGGWMVLLAHCELGLLDMSLALDAGDKIAGLKFTPHVATSPEPEKP